MSGLMLLVLALLAALAVSGCGGKSGGESAAGQHRSVTDFATDIAASGTTLIDVRTPAEFAAGHLANATNIDVEAADFAQRIAALDKAGTYALYCRTGHRSGVALETMSKAGFTHVFDLSGGITAWQAAGKPVTTA